MGTNYYIRYNICECCDRHDELHLGVSSYGWSFTFQAINQRLSFKETDPKAALLGENETRFIIVAYRNWKEFITRYVINYKTAKIYDEYEDEVSPKQLYDLIESKKNGKSHYKEAQDKYSFLDNEGNSFISNDFS